MLKASKGIAKIEYSQAVLSDSNNSKNADESKLLLETQPLAIINDNGKTNHSSFYLILFRMTFHLSYAKRKNNFQFINFFK